VKVAGHFSAILPRKNSEKPNARKAIKSVQREKSVKYCLVQQYVSKNL